MKTRLAVAGLAVFLLVLASPAMAGATTGGRDPTPSGQVFYYTVSGGVCTTTPVPLSQTQSDGSVPGMFSNNVGGPPNTVKVGTGQVCIKVVLTGATPSSSYTVTDGGKLAGTITITTDSSGDGSGEAVFTSTYSGSCTTTPLKMTPTTPFTIHTNIGSDGQINHVWVGTGTCVESAPEFPLGLVGVFALGIPALFVLRKKMLPWARV